MGDIYENSHITIAATASQDSNGGLFSSNRPVMRRLNKHPHLGVRKVLEAFPKTVIAMKNTSIPLLTRAWVYQERRLSTRTIHFAKDQVYWECKTQFASEDAGEDMTWKTHAEDFKDIPEACWGDVLVDCTSRWQKMISEYSSLQLTYESDRLPAIAALADRMSKLREVDDVYIAGMWKNSILLDLLWLTRDHKPRPARTAPSWSWASTQSSVIVWDSFEFPQRANVVSLEYTATGAAVLGEVANASIVLLVPFLNLTGGHDRLSADLNDLNRGRHFEDISSFALARTEFRKKCLEYESSIFFADYDLATTNPPYTPERAVKLLVAKDNLPGNSLCGIVVQETSKNAAEYERIGSLFVRLKIMAHQPQEESIEDWEVDGRIDRLILSLPMEEVKIV